MPNALGLDIGRTMGFALAGSQYVAGWKPRTALEGPRDSNKGLVSGEWNLGPGDHDSLFAGLFHRLEDLHSVSPLSVIFYESSGGRYQSEAAVWIQIGLAAVIRCWARLHEIPSELINNGTVKSHAAHYGKAEKGDMIRAAQRLGWDPQGDHEADALFVLDAKLSEWHRLKR